MEVLLIDDHPLVNCGLTACLEETGRFTVSGQAVSLEEGRHFIEGAETLPSLVILDILVGEENGLDFLPYLKNYCRKKNVKPPPVLVCSVMEDPFRLRTALKLGAAGYIAKASGKAELLGAIETVLRGEVYISPEHSDILNDSTVIYSQFTKRELELLDLIKKNNSNQQIAKTLGISIRTVENHISNIYFKTGAETRLELIKM